jgi:Uma2 family endonuclease
MTTLFSRKASNRTIPPLENGQRLAASEFLRRYEETDEDFKAELIDGIVYMASPVRAKQHGEPDALIQGWLSNYTIATPGISHALNSTIRLTADDVPQPDGFLRIRPEYGGQCSLDEDGYVVGAPELAVEIAASSSSLDFWAKRESYRRAGIREYLLWLTEDRRIEWWFLEEDEYRALPREAGIIKSKVFPGLWLKVDALLAQDGAKVMQTLRAGLKSAEHRAFLKKLKNSRS